MSFREYLKDLAYNPSFLILLTGLVLVLGGIMGFFV